MSELKVHKAYNRWIDEEMPTPNDDLICNEVYLKAEADKFIAELKADYDEVRGRLQTANLIKDKQIVELKAKLEDAKATAYAESVDAGMENRRLKRALWLARSYRGRDNSILLPSKFMRNVWDNVERKCLKKAEQYK